MNMKLLAILALWVGFLLVSIPAFAHHGGASLYDMEKATTVKATITDFIWANPHCEISFDGIDERGNARHWTIEAHPPNIMLTHGWTKKSLKPGDVLTITFHPGKNGGGLGQNDQNDLPRRPRARPRLDLQNETSVFEEMPASFPCCAG
jgi:hypothetical protein